VNSYSRPSNPAKPPPRSLPPKHSRMVSYSASCSKPSAAENTLGAQQREILRMVLRRGVTLLAAGIGIGQAASCALTRFLASQIWGVSATDPWAFGAVVVVVAGIGSVACYLPARRATRVDPLVALKYE
jgi:ABC-type lipoprotein release transport system permease subunit